MKKKLLFKNGTVTTLYDDTLSQTLLTTLGGEAEISRASHVEAPGGPHKTIEFHVDLRPSNGPILKGFKSYQEAVSAEIDWLHQNKITTTKH